MPAQRLVRRVWRRLRRGPPRGVDLLALASGFARRKQPQGGTPADAGLAEIANLPETIEYTGEFGAELILFLPWCNWLSRQGLLRGRRIRTYRGMRCFYDDLDCIEIQEKDDRRHYVPLRRRMLPVRDEHDFDGRGRSPFHLYPDLRRRFGALPFSSPCADPGKPLLVVHNKYNHEWDGAPTNFIPLDVLAAIFAKLEASFTVVYIRHGMGERPPGYSDDEMNPLAFDDEGVLMRHPEILRFDELFADHRRHGGSQDINTFKNALYSRCYLFITVQGGGAHHIALFAGSCMVVLHKRGREDELAYGDGYYSFMANPSPLRVVCRAEQDLIESLALFDDVAIVRDRALIAPKHAALLERLSPFPEVAAERVAPVPATTQ